MAILGDYQAIPITINTFIGVATDKSVIGYRLVVSEAAGTITFHMPAGTDNIVATPEAGGIAYEVDDNCTGVTSTASIIMS